MNRFLKDDEEEDAPETIRDIIEKTLMNEDEPELDPDRDMTWEKTDFELDLEDDDEEPWYDE